MVEFKTPEMGLETPEQGIRQIQSYLFQLANQLNYAFSVLDGGQTGGEDAAALADQKTGDLRKQLVGIQKTVGTISGLTQRISESMRFGAGGVDILKQANFVGGLLINGEPLDDYIRKITEEDK